MPKKPLKPCSKPGCSELVQSGRCEKHSKEYKKEKWKETDKNRPPSSQRGYDSRWRKVRRMKLARQPLCEECNRNGLVKQAQEVHHKMPIAQGGSNRIDNLESLCRSCHKRKEMEGGGVKS